MATQLPPVPTNVVISRNHEKYHVTYDEVADPEALPITYVWAEMYVDGALVGAESQVVPYPGKLFEFYNSNFTVGSVVSFRIALVNSVGAGEYSEMSNTLVHGEGWVAPVAPTSVEVVHVGNSNFRVVVTHPNPISQPEVAYYQYQVLNATKTVVATDNIIPLVNDVRWIGNLANEAHTVQVKALNSVGESPWSEESPEFMPNPSVYYGGAGVITNFRWTVEGQFVKVEWDPPTETGGIPLVGYSIGISALGEYYMVEQPQIYVRNVIIGIPLEVTISAKNGSWGNNTVAKTILLTADEPPLAPSIEDVRSGAGLIQIDVAPPNDLGRPMPNRYKVVVEELESPGGPVLSSNTYYSQRGTLVGGATPGALLRLTAYAANDWGWGSASDAFEVTASASITPPYMPEYIQPPKLKAFRATVTLEDGSVESTVASFMSTVEQYLLESGFLITRKGEVIDPGSTFKGVKISFRPAQMRAYDHMNPHWFLEATVGWDQSVRFNMGAFEGVDYAQIATTPDDSLKLTESGLARIYVGTPEEFYFYADGGTGSWGLVQSKIPTSGADARGRYGGVLGVIMDYPFQAHQTSSVFPYYGLYEVDSGFYVPWVKALGDYPVGGVPVEEYWTDRYYTTVSPLGGWAASGDAIRLAPSSPLAKSLSEILVVPEGDDEQAFPSTYLKGVYMASNFGWEDWEQFGPYIILPAYRDSETSHPRYAKMAVPCPLSGYDLVTFP